MSVGKTGKEISLKKSLEQISVCSVGIVLFDAFWRGNGCTYLGFRLT